MMVVMLAGSIGLHWGLLQSVAWTSMLVDHLRTDTLAEAVQHTFDGKHPCCLCKAIAAGKQSEKKHAGCAQSDRFEFINETGAFVLIGPAAFHLLQLNDTFALACPHAPPTPPPRSA